jgi:hypothetical protein
VRKQVTKRLNVMRLTTNHDEIRHWVEDNAGIPAVSKFNSPSTPKGLYIDFLSNGKNKELKPISWDEFFSRMDNEHLALEYEDTLDHGIENRKYRFTEFIYEDLTKE